MAIDRRIFMVGLGAVALSTLSGPSVGMTRTMFVTSARNRLDGRFYVVGLDQRCEITWQEPLPSRAHAPVIRPKTDMFAIIARRPDRFCELRRASNGEKIHQIDAVHGRHFYGHGTFDPTGRYLFLTENAYDQGRGVIGIYDAFDNFNRIEEVSSGGIGPHEISLMPDGKSLVVANGGIRTHPDQGRKKLNLESIIPSLQIINITTGQLEQQIRFGDKTLHSLSTRHIAVMAEDRIIVACQDQSISNTPRPLVYKADSNSGTLTPLQTPEPLLKKMSGYVGSIAISSDNQLIAASCPRGNIVVFWDANTWGFQGSIASHDVCGLAGLSDAGTIISTTGTGNIALLSEQVRPKQSIRHPFLQWDNHITRIQ